MRDAGLLICLAVLCNNFQFYVKVGVTIVHPLDIKFLPLPTDQKSVFSNQRKHDLFIHTLLGVKFEFFF